MINSIDGEPIIVEGILYLMIIIPEPPELLPTHACPAPPPLPVFAVPDIGATLPPTLYKPLPPPPIPPTFVFESVPNDDVKPPPPPPI